MKSETKKVTAKLAAEYLKTNWKNRTIRPAQISVIACDIREGRWELNGESLKFDVDGNMIDGQHRCLAIVEANKTVETLIVTGLPRKVQRTLGGAVSRNFADELTMRGVAYASVASSAARTCAVFDRFGHWEGKFIREISITDQGAAFDRHEDGIMAACKFVVRLYNANKGGHFLPTQSMMAGLLVHFRRHDDKVADWFVERCYTGVGLGEDEPVFRLRRMFNPRDIHRRMGHAMRHAVTIKAFNLTCEGRTVTKLTWRRTGPSPEPFPRIGIYEPADEDAEQLEAGLDDELGD